MTDSDPEPDSGIETEAEKRARVMRRLAEILREDPPSMPTGGPVTAGGLEAARAGLDPSDEATSDLLAALLRSFEGWRRPRGG